MNDSGKRALFLDRDGVINVDRGYVYLPQQTEWVPGIFELCRVAQEYGYCVIVITNQAGIARGYYSEAQFEAYTHWVQAQFAERGIPILATYHCPHHPTEGIGALRRKCDCRKPKPGMILRAIRDHGIVAERSVLIGDNISDVDAGLSAHVGSCLLLGENNGSVCRSIETVYNLAQAGKYLSALAEKAISSESGPSTVNMN
jgi:D-glycero-D-manno-heptose 1,7-bisphosphate phosphatase